MRWWNHMVGDRENLRKMRGKKVGKEKRKQCEIKTKITKNVDQYAR